MQFQHPTSGRGTSQNDGLAASETQTEFPVEHNKKPQQWGFDFSIVIPVRDEENNIVPLLQEIQEACDPLYRYEIIFVDDGSVDGTYKEIENSQHSIPQLRVLRLKNSVGQSTAIHLGVSQASGPWIITLDGDGQNDPLDIPILFENLRQQEENGAVIDCLAGHREKRQDSFSKRWQSKIANRVRQFLLHDETPDTGCGLKILRRDSFLKLPYFDHMHRFYPALFRAQGGQVKVVPVRHRARRSGTTKYGLWNRLGAGLVDIVGVMWLIRRTRRATLVKGD